MVDSQRLTPLNFALLGLCLAEPRSGYALRRIFETSPIGTFSSSPGSIYPSLKKLESLGLLARQPTGRGGSAVFGITSDGRKALKDWLGQPLTTEEVARDIDATMLRLALLDLAGDADDARRLLEGIVDRLSTHVAFLEAYLAGPEGKALGRYARIAVESGLGAFRAHLRNAAEALAEHSNG